LHSLPPKYDRVFLQGEIGFLNIITKNRDCGTTKLLIFITDIITDTEERLPIDSYNQGK
jgi:hypothetical protein